MPIIIDGWNLIRDRSSDIDDEDGDSLDSARTLLAYLADFQKAHGDPMIVVFDSSHEFLGADFKSAPNLTIVPAKSADNYIKRYIDKTPERQRRNVRVVSSDNDVFYYAKSAYAMPIKSEEFWVKLKGGGRVSGRSHK